MGIRPFACERAREWVSLQLDDELSELERTLMRAHLVRCADCRMFASDLGALTGRLRSESLELLAQPIVVPMRRVGLRAVNVAAALAAGVAAGGGHALLGGVLPTPGASLLVRRYGFDLAAVVSASHNPYQDNGIKFFGPEGIKLDDAQEAEIERLLGAPGVGSTPPISASPPAAATPAATAASSMSPDSRVSRMISAFGACSTMSATRAVAARASAIASSAVRNWPATPRTPSVPNSVRATVYPPPPGVRAARSRTTTAWRTEAACGPS